MKLAKLSSLLFVPLAFCATVPNANKIDADVRSTVYCYSVWYINFFAHL